MLANNNWIYEYKVDEDYLHFGGRSYTYSENIGYFFGNDRMKSIRTNGKIIKEKYPSLAGSYGFFYDDLYDTIVKKEPLKVKPEHGFNTIRLIELATESNEKKCRIACTGLIDISYP